MQWWKDLKIKTKFFGALFVALVVALVCGASFFASFKALNDSEERQSAATELNISLLEREIQHMQWVSALSSYISMRESADLNISKDGHQCAFGKWYYGGELANFIKLFPEIAEDFKALETPHNRLHQTAAEIEKLQKEGKYDAVKTLYEKTTLPAMQAVQQHFAVIRGKLHSALTHAAAATAEITHSLQILLMAVCVIAGIVFMLFSFVFVKAVLNPIAQISSFAAESLLGKKPKLYITGKDELGSLAQNLTALMDHLHKQLAYSQGVLNGITVPCSVFSPDDKTVFTNKYMIDIIERTGEPEEMIGLTSGEYILGDKNAETSSSVALREQRIVRVERSITTHKGNEIHVIISSSPFYDAQNNLLGTLSIWGDVTEIVQKQRIIEENGVRLAQIAQSASDVAQNVSSTSVQLAAQVEQASKGASMQSMRVSEAAETMAEMNETVLEVARSASDSSHTAAAAMENAQIGSQVVSNMTQSFQHVEKYTEEVKSGMDSLGNQAEGVGAIISVITDIADQTNLLALNAAIEAARAGEAGRGFAVVADEVRKLAEKTMQATSEVSAVITGIQHGTRENITSVERSVQAVNEAASQAQEAGNTLNSIVHIVEETAGQIQSIASAAEEQSQTSNVIHEKLEDVRNISSETAAAMAEASEAVENLAQQASILNELIEQLNN